jgi:hypothetical protein
MALSAVLGRGRLAAPLRAFLATAALSVLLAAQAQLACSRQMVMTMPGMEMPASSGVIALCPIVLLLGLAAAFLSAYAVATLAFGPHRRATGRALVRRYAQLPLHAVGGSVLALGSGSVGMMMALDGSTPAGLSGWLLLAGIVIAVAFATALAGLGVVRALLALGDRIAFVLAAEVQVLRRGALVPAFTHRPRAATAARRVPLLAARRGLRAPPFSGR